MVAAAKRSGPRGGYLAAETRRERAEMAEMNVDPEHIALWRKVGPGIKGTSPCARAAAFAEYAEEHTGESMEAMQASADATLELLIASRPVRGTKKNLENRTVRTSELSGLTVLYDHEQVSEATPPRRQRNVRRAIARTKRIGASCSHTGSRFSLHR